MLRRGKLLARSRPFRFALLIQDNLPYSACHASAQTSGCGRHLFYASKPSLPHSRHFPHLRHSAHAPAPRLKHREVDEWRSERASFNRCRSREQDAFRQKPGESLGEAASRARRTAGARGARPVRVTRRQMQARQKDEWESGELRWLAKDLR